MLRKGMTIREATEHWVNQFNAIPTGMIEKLMRYDPAGWREITLPSYGDRVRLHRRRKGCDEGEIRGFDGRDYNIWLSDIASTPAFENEFDVIRDEPVPMWGTMWSFGERPDDDWLAGPGALRAMSNCGFRIFESDEFGYFFGIDGAGYDFYEEHWVPLYKARGLEWHDPATEKVVG